MSEETKAREPTWTDLMNLLTLAMRDKDEALRQRDEARAALATLNLSALRERDEARAENVRLRYELYRLRAVVCDADAESIAVVLAGGGS